MKTSVQLLLQEQQYQMALFGHKFLTNKPVVYQGASSVKPYNNLFYWSHGYARETSQFDLHPHEGFEILSYVIEGSNDHYDTSTERWTPLGAGDFQIIQAGSRISHAERLNQGTRAFQIWFDPDFAKSLEQEPAYSDYHASMWPEQKLDRVFIRDLVGGESPARMLTPGLLIQRWFSTDSGTMTFKVEAGRTAHFYMVNGEAIWNGEESVICPINSSLKLEGPVSGEWKFESGSELFLISTLQELEYRRIWQSR